MKCKTLLSEKNKNYMYFTCHLLKFYPACKELWFKYNLTASSKSKTADDSYEMPRLIFFEKKN